jgi:uncharacterized protein YbcI
MIHIDDRISAKRARPDGTRLLPVNLSQLTTGEKIAQAADAFESRRTKHARKWVAVFMNQETIVIALHGSLTVAEKAHAQSAAGAAETQEFHRRLFTDFSAILCRKIKDLTGMEVRHTTVEIEPTTGSIVRLFTTNTAGEDIPLAPVGLVETSMPGSGSLCRHDGRFRPQAYRTGFVIRG